MLVVDASVLAPVVADGASDGRRFRERLRGEALVGPDLLRLEVVSVLRGHASGAVGLIVEDQRPPLRLAVRLGPCLEVGL